MTSALEGGVTEELRQEKNDQEMEQDIRYKALSRAYELHARYCCFQEPLWLTRKKLLWLRWWRENVSSRFPTDSALTERFLTKRVAFMEGHLE